MIVRKRDRLRRPPGYPPKGSSYGLVGCVLLPLMPLVVSVTLLPVFRNGETVVDDVLIYNLAIALPLLVIVLFAFFWRRLWSIRLVYAWGVACLATYAAAVLVWSLVFFRVLPEAHPQLRFILILSGIYLLAGALFSCWITRMLRLRFWQPWSQPEQWEPPDPAAARWAKLYGLPAPPEKW